MPGLREVGDLADLRAQLLGRHDDRDLPGRGRGAGAAAALSARSLPQASRTVYDGGDAGAIASDGRRARSAAAAGRSARARRARSRRATANPAASPAAGSPFARRLAATIAPVSPVPSAVPSESVSDRALVDAPCASGGRLAQDDERERRIGEAHPEPGDAEREDRDSQGTSGSSTSEHPGQAEQASRRSRAWTKRWVGQRVAPRAWIHAPAVQAMVAAVSAMPGLRRRHARASSTRVRATKASTPKNVQVRMPRSRTAAGRTGRATRVPGGVSRRSAKMPSARPATLRTTVGIEQAGRQPDRQQARPEGDRDGQRQPAAPGCGARRVGRRAAASAIACRAPERQGAGQRDQRQQAEEDVAPADRVADGPGDGRADHAGQDPGRRERGEHPRPQRLGERPADGDVGDRLDRARAEALEEPGADQDRHRRRRGRRSAGRWRTGRGRAANGTASPPRSIAPPTTTMPMSEPRKNAEKTQP